MITLMATWMGIGPGTGEDVLLAAGVLLLMACALVLAYRGLAVPETPRLLPSADLAPEPLWESAYIEITDAYDQRWLVHLADIVAICHQSAADLNHMEPQHRLSFLYLGLGTAIRIEVRPQEAKQVQEAWEEWAGFDNRTRVP